jgi:transcriptional regulator with XRE-family HTH domain
MTLGDRIKEIRGKRSRDTFAQETGITRNTVVNYEGGIRTPDAEYLNKILELHPEISPAWLLREEGPKFRPAGGTTDHLPEYATIDQVSAVALREINRMVAELPPGNQWDVIGKINRILQEMRQDEEKKKDRE